MPSLFLIPHTSLAPDLMLLPRTGSPLSKSPSSSLFLNAYSLSLNRHELGIYCGPNLAPGNTDTNMIRQNLALVSRCSHTYWWKRCNWVHERHLLPNTVEIRGRQRPLPTWKTLLSPGIPSLWSPQGNFSYKEQPYSLTSWLGLQGTQLAFLLSLPWWHYPTIIGNILPHWLWWLHVCHECRLETRNV